MVGRSSQRRETASPVGGGSTITAGRSTITAGRSWVAVRQPSVSAGRSSITVPRSPIRLLAALSIALLVGIWIVSDTVESASPPDTAPEVGFLNWYASDGLEARETYTIRRETHALSISARIERRDVDTVRVTRSRFVTRSDGTLDSLYLWHTEGESPAILVPPVPALVPPFVPPLVPYDERAGFHLLAYLVGRHAPLDSLPGRLRLHPHGELTIRAVSDDSVDAGGTHLQIRRYRVDGLPVGPWHLWLNVADHRPLAGLTLGAERGICAEGFGRVLLRFTRLAWRDEGEDVAARVAAAATRFEGPVALIGARVDHGIIDDGADDRSIVETSIDDDLPGTLLIDQGVVVAIGREAGIELPAEVTRIDLRGLRVKPGRRLENGPVAPDSLLAALRQGFTTVVARPGYFGAMAREAAADLTWIGPHLETPADSDTNRALRVTPGELRVGDAADCLVVRDDPDGRETVVQVLCGGVLIDLERLAPSDREH